MRGRLGKGTLYSWPRVVILVVTDVGNSDARLLSLLCYCLLWRLRVTVSVKRSVLRRFLYFDAGEN